MRRFLIILYFACTPLPAHAWNAAGHHLVAGIAWQKIAPETRRQIGEMLVRHPDYDRWAEKAASTDPRDIFAEASTWPDNIRHDPRFYDEKREAPTPPIPGLPDTARHKTWHYVDMDAAGLPRAGEADKQIERLHHLLRPRVAPESPVWALPWLIHLVADIHQPLHVGHHGDEGGNSLEIENPFNRRQPFTNLHSYWDDLPGASGLRGKRLAETVLELLARYPAPVRGTVRLWRDESHALLVEAYPPENGSLLPIVSPEFDARAREIAQRRIVAAGYRLAALLDDIFAQRVSRETP